jgi:hypothetical protein
MENMKVQFLEKNQFLRYDVTKWHHNIKILLDLESTNQALWYEVLHDMVPPISKCDLGVSNFWPAARPMKVKADQPQKLVNWVADHMLLSHQVWSWSDKATQKIRVLLKP